MLFLLWSLADMEGIGQSATIYEDCLRAVGKAVRAEHLAPASHWTWRVSATAATAVRFLSTHTHTHTVSYL